MEEGHSFIYNDSEMIVKEGLKMRIFIYDITSNQFVEGKGLGEIDKGVHLGIADCKLIKSVNELLYMRQDDGDLLVI